MAGQDPYAATAIKPVAKKTQATAPTDDPYAATAEQTVAPSLSTAPPPTPGWRDRLTKIDPHVRPTPADYANSLAALKYTGREGLKVLSNIGGLGLTPFVHPIDTAQSFVASLIPSSLGRSSLDDWQKKVIDPWQAAHPGQPIPANLQISDRDRALVETPDPFTAAAASLMPPEAIEYGTTHGREGDLRAKVARGETLSADDQAYLNLSDQLGGMGGHPLEFLEGLAGQTASMHLASGLKSQLVSGARSAAEGAVRRLAGSGPGVASKLVREAAEDNRKIALHNADRYADAQQVWREKQIKALTDHKAELLRLKQKHAQDTRAAQEKARTGTDADRTAYKSKQLAAKQKYEQSVRDQTEKYQAERAKAEQSNADAQREYNRKIGETARQNREATAAERAKADQSAHLQVGGSQLIYGLNQLDKALRAKAGVMFDGVRELVAKSKQPPLPGTELGTAARAALTKISGSSTVPRPFSDILAKYPESDPEFIEDPTKGINSLGKVGKDSPYYELLKQRFGGGAAAPPVTFADLQGYYTETGAELAKGTLPGDVYTATKELHNAIGDMMQKMAKNAGPEANKMFWDSRVFYRDYMDTFHEPTGPSSSGSPVAQALQAKDPLVAVEKFTGKSGNRGVADLRRFSASLANLAQDVQQWAQADITVPARKSVVDIPAPKSKPLPAGSNLPLPPILEPMPAPRAANLPLPPVMPEPEAVPFKEPKPTPARTISVDDIRRANEASVQRRGSSSVGALVRLAVVWPAFHMLMDAMRGREVSPSGLLAIPAAGTTGAAVEQVLSIPDVNEFLTRPSRQQMAQIPQDLRGDMPQIVAAARSRGIQVNPLLVAYAATIQRNQGRRQQQPPSAPQGAPQ